MLTVHRRANDRVIHAFILKRQWSFVSDLYILSYILHSQLFPQLNESLFSLFLQSFTAVCAV